MDAQYTKRLQEWVKWYMYHKTSMKNASLEKKVEFLEKSVHGLLELSALTYEEIARVDEGRDKPIQILLPTGVDFHEPIRSK